jgi:hypothetical protein
MHYDAEAIEQCRTGFIEFADTLAAKVLYVTMSWSERSGQ